jgi:hypothetical protein
VGRTAPEEARHLLGRSLGGAGKLVLLRAEGITERLEGFSVTWRERAVKVYHLARAVGPPKLIRRAVVARLPDLPTKVYMDFSILD